MSCPVLVKYEQQLLSSSCGEAKSSTDHGNNPCIKITIINFQLPFIHIFNAGSITATPFCINKIKKLYFPLFHEIHLIHNFTPSLDQDFLLFRPLFFYLLSFICIISPSPFKNFPSPSTSSSRLPHPPPPSPPLIWLGAPSYPERIQE